jgi:EmrB/QacA subfamily drug resistance transporter
VTAPIAREESVSWGTPGAHWVLLATVLGSGLAFLDMTVVNVALPTIGTALDASVAGLQWIVNGYTLTLTSLILIGGSLGDRFGRRRIFLVGVVWFAAASLLCAVAPTSKSLVAARALQGIGGALLTPGSLAILQASFAPGDRGRAVGAWSGLSGIAGAIGPFVGGWLIAVGSWRLIFLINVPLAAVVVAVAMPHVPETRDPTAAGRIDVTGAVLTAVGLAGVTWALTEAGEHGATAAVLSAGALGMASLAGFVAAEQHIRNPMLPLDLFRSQQFTAANLVTLIVYASLGVTFFLLVVQLQQVLGYSPMQAGLATMPITGLMLVLSAGAGRLADRVGPRLPMTVGPLCIAAGLALLSRVQAGATYVGTVLPGLLAFGLGLSLTVPPDRHRACGGRCQARRYSVRRQQRDLAGRRPPRRRRDTRARRSHRPCLSRPSCVREWFSCGNAYECRAGRGRWGARVVPDPQRGRRPSGPLPGGQARSAPLLCGRRHAAGHQARRGGSDTLRCVGEPVTDYLRMYGSRNANTSGSHVATLLVGKWCPSSTVCPTAG